MFKGLFINFYFNKFRFFINFEFILNSEERALLSYLDVVAFFDNIFELLQGGGNVLGAGGGFLAAALYRKLDVASKNAKNALAIAKRAEELVKNEVKVGIEAGMKEATRYVDEQLAKKSLAEAKLSYPLTKRRAVASPVSKPG